MDAILTWLASNKEWFFSGLGVALMLVIFEWTKRTGRAQENRGGSGGSAHVGGSGIALGGRGGRAGESGVGGDGGGGFVAGDGWAQGGHGGDAGVPARPALGAASPLGQTNVENLTGLTDEFGIPQPGRGGDAYSATIAWNGKDYSLNVLLRLLNGPVPPVVNRPDILDKVDEAVSASGASNPQDWWDIATALFPDETAKVVAHYDACVSRD